MIYIRKDTKERCNPAAPYTSSDGVRYPRMPADLYEAFDEPTFVGDDETYYHRLESPTAPYVTWERKTDEYIALLKNERIQQQIDADERNTLLPRVTREFMLAAFEAQAAAANLDPMLNVGYKRMKELDDAIKAKRQQIVIIPKVEPV